MPTIVSDPFRVRQIVGNLLSNAIKYTPPRGRINAHVRRAGANVPAPGDWVVVDVTDTGRGIPADTITKVFDEFVRLDPKDGGGAGVGLAIGQRLARALRGMLTVESREGGGSRFSLRLPLQPLTSPPRAAPPPERPVRTAHDSRRHRMSDPDRRRNEQRRCFQHPEQLGRRRAQSSNRVEPESSGADYDQVGPPLVGESRNRSRDIVAKDYSVVDRDARPASSVAADAVEFTFQRLGCDQCRPRI